MEQQFTGNQLDSWLQDDEEETFEEGVEVEEKEVSARAVQVEENTTPCRNCKEPIDRAKLFHHYFNSSKPYHCPKCKGEN